MAGQTIGSALIIPQEALDKIKEADDKLKNIQATATATANQVNIAFQNMASSTTPFISKLDEVINKLSQVGSAASSANAATGGFGQSGVSGVQNFSSAIQQAIANITQMAALLQTSGSTGASGLLIAKNAVDDLVTALKNTSGMNIAQLKEEIAAINSMLKDSSYNLTKDDQNVLNEKKKLLQDELKEQERTTKQREEVYLKALDRMLQAEQSFQNKQKKNEADKAKKEQELIKQQNSTYDGSLQFSSTAKTLNQQKEAIEYLTKARHSLSIEDSEYEKKLETLNAAIERHTQLLDKAKGKTSTQTRSDYSVSYNKYLSNTSAVLENSKNAKTIQEHVTAIKQLEQARLRLDTTDKNYKQTLSQVNNAINQHSKELQRAGVAANNLSEKESYLAKWTSQWIQRTIAMFSINSVKNLMNGIAEVRGEFELTQRSLESILQDKPKADQIFQKTVELAIKSPFQIKELVSYTKQLAAYRIEGDELYDTTKRLADVSAGLGVDMQRLILAYGQVKAAAYLRGSEVRQFTEAGVNMYGELQSYFKEVKGEAYTTAEIVDMISKRQVSFEDVEQVFKRLTSEGGLFFNMQEVQAETLKGKIANLQDSMDVMLNSIGKSHEGMLKGFVDSAKWIIDNWEIIANVMKSLVPVLILLQLHAIRTGVALTNLFSTNMMTASSRQLLGFRQMFTQCFSSIGQVIKNFAANMSAALATNAWVIAIIALVLAAKGWYTYHEKVKEAEEDTIKGIAAINGMAEAYDKLAEAKKKADSADKKGGADISDEEAAKNIEARRIQLQKLINYAANNGLKLEIDVQTIKEEELDKTFAVVKEKYENFLYQLETIKKTYAENDKWNTWLTDGFDDDMEDYHNAMADILSQQTKMQTSIASYLDNYDKIINKTVNTDGRREKIESAFKVLRKAREEGESELAYFVRINEAMESIEKNAKKMDYTDVYNPKEVGILNDIPHLSIWNYDSDITAAKNAENELIKELRNITQKLDEETKKDPVMMKAIIDSVAANKSWDQYTRELVYRQFNITIGINKDETKDEITWVDDYLAHLFATKKYGINIKVDKIDDDEALKGYLEKGDKAGKAAKNWKELRKRLEAMNGNTEKVKLDSELRGLFNTGGKSDMRIASLLAGDEIAVKDLLDIVDEYQEAATELAKDFGVDPFEKDKNKSAKSQRDIINERINLYKEMNSKYQEFIKMEGKASAAQKTRSYFAESAKSVGVDISNFIPDRKTTAKKIKELAYQYSQATKRAGALRTSADIEIKIEEDDFKKKIDALQDRLDEIMSQRELHLKLDELGLSESEIRMMFGELPETWDSVRKSIEDGFVNLFGADKSLWGEDVTEKYKDRMTKLNEDIYKDQVSQMQELVKAYKNKLSEQLQLDSWYISERNKIIKNENLQKNPELREQMLGNLKKQYNQKTSENTWNAFKGSETYLSMFDNLEYISTKAITHMREKLDTLREQMKDLEPTQLKEVMTLYNKMDEQLTKRNPFKSLVDSLKEIEKLEAKGITENSLNRTIIDNDAENAELEKQISVYSRIIALKQEGTELTAEDKDFIKENNSLYNMTLPALKSIVKEKQKNIGDNNDSTKKATENLRYYSKARNSLSELSDAWSTVKSVAAQTFGNIKTILEAMGEDTDSTASSIISLSGTLVDIAVQAVMFELQLKLCAAQAKVLGVEMNAAMGPIGWICLALQAVTSILSSILGNSDKAIQKRIEEQQRLVNALQHSYEKLKDAIDNAFDSQILIENTEAAKKNIEAQITAYEAMLRAEKKKKKSDKDRIQEYEQEIDDLRDSLKELAEDELEAFGGFGSKSNYKSAAEEFAEAWVDAFNEGESALDALNDKFDEYFDNMLTKQITQRTTTRFIEPILKAFDNAVSEGSEGGNNGADVTENELANLKKLKSENLEAYNEYLKNLMTALGVSARKDIELSGLQQGIQSVTESTAEALESILNSVRYYVAQQAQDVSIIRTLLQSQYGDAGNSANGANPQLTILQQQTSYLQKIVGYWDSVVRPNHSKGRSGIRVFMD